MPRYGGSLAFEAAMNESPYSQYDSGEDGMFEENIMYPVVLYAEMLWNCNSDTKELIKTVAQRSYVCFA